MGKHLDAPDFREAVRNTERPRHQFYAYPRAGSSGFAPPGNHLRIGSGHSIRHTRAAVSEVPDRAQPQDVHHDPPWDGLVHA